MSHRRRVVGLLDRPGGRALLSWAATWYARHLSQADVQVWYDGLWWHRSGSYRFPDGPRFRYFRDHFLRRREQAETMIRDAHEYWYHGGCPRRGETVIDVGAGRGEDVLAFSNTVGPEGRVLAIEAHPVTFALLKRFCIDNRLDNAVPIQMATLDGPGTVTMGDADEWTENTVGRAGYMVPADTLDAICRREAPGPIGLLKMNIEGAESPALRGAVEVLARTRLVAVACHDFRADRGHGETYRTRRDVQAFLASQGFTVTARASDSRDWVRDHVFGVRTSNAGRHGPPTTALHASADV